MSETPSQSQATEDPSEDDAIVRSAFGDAPFLGRFSPSQNLWGYGGLHGGLTLALLAQAMQQQLPTKRIVQISANIPKNVRGPFEIVVEVEHTGRTATHMKARAVIGDQFLAGASAVFADISSQVSGAVVAPNMPAVPAALQCAPFKPPNPVSKRTELRPVGDRRPFQGGNIPELTAWLRVRGDDTPVEFFRLAFLMDALAPSYSAILDKPVMIPTVTITMYPSFFRAAASSPWVLLKAVTKVCAEGGWIEEHIDAWGEDGMFLGSASQRRLVLQQP